MLEKLADLGMRLAESAADRAFKADAALPPEPEVASPPRAARTDHFLFDRLARTVTTLVSLKLRLTGGKPRTAPHEEPQTSADPRRHPISAFMHDAIEDSPKPKQARAVIHHQIEPRIDERLAEDPELRVCGGEIILDLCQEFDIPFSLSRMPDELLVPPGETAPTGYAEFLARQAENLTGSDPPSDD